MVILIMDRTKDTKTEHRLELAMEGSNRFWEIVHKGDDSAVLGYKVDIEGDHELWPIPKQEIGKISMVQNPG